MTAHDSSPSAHKEPTDTATDAQRDDLDSGMTEYGSEAGWARLTAPGADGPAHFTVRGERLREGRGFVTISMRAGGYDLMTQFDPDDARALAAKLRSAAAYAEGEDR
jgi:hypothetical protein